MALGEWGRKVWYLFHRERLARELREEVEAHREAHREAMGEPVTFGNALRLREESQDIWGWTWLDHCRQDLRYALRTLRLSPGFTLTAVLILSLGIGLNISLFQFVDARLFRPLPVRDADTLARFYLRTATRTSSGMPYPATQFVRRENTVLSAVLTETGRTVTWNDGEARRVSASFVSANWFAELGYSNAALGRSLAELIDEAPDAAPVVVLSHAFWRTRLGSDPEIAGKTVRINNQAATVAGVVAENFPGLSSGTADLWAPIGQLDYFYGSSEFQNDWTSHNTDIYGRLKTGVSLDAVREGLSVVMEQLAQQRPQDFEAGTWLEPYSGSVRFKTPQDLQSALPVLAGIFALTGLVLLIACANLSNLVLSRAMGRVRELSVRLALGASRGRLLRQLAAESLVLSAVGAAGGLLVSYWAAALLGNIAAGRAYTDFGMDWKTFAAAFMAAAFTALFMGFAPAWKVARQDLSSAMKDGGAQTSGGLERTRLRQFLLTAQVAGSCLLLVVAATAAQGLRHILRSNPGFEFEHVAILQPRLSDYGIAGAEARLFWERMKDNIAAHPETDGLALVSQPPLGGSLSSSTFRSAPGLRVTMLDVDPEFFAVMKIPILQGRALNANDDYRTAVVISRRLALEMYGTLDVLGKGFPLEQSKQIIVGVAGDAAVIRYEANEAVQAYSPINPESLASMVLVVRAKNDPEQLLAPLRLAAGEADERVLADVQLARTNLEEKIRGPRLASLFAGLSALLTLCLACLGIFGVVSYGVRLRTKEIGIRMALGARSVAILRLVAGQHTRFIGLGLCLGMAASLPVMRLFGEAPLYLGAPGWLVYAVAGLFFAFTAALALALPARQALSTEPSRTLRQE